MEVWGQPVSPVEALEFLEDWFQPKIELLGLGKMTTRVLSLLAGWIAMVAGFFLTFVGVNMIGGFLLYMINWFWRAATYLFYAAGDMFAEMDEVSGEGANIKKKKKNTMIKRITPWTMGTPRMISTLRLRSTPRTMGNPRTICTPKTMRTPRTRLTLTTKSTPRTKVKTRTIHTLRMRSTPKARSTLMSIGPPRMSNTLKMRSTPLT